MGSANAAYMSNQIIATGAAINILNVGFLPRKIRVTNLTNQIRVEWTEGLPSGTNLQIIANGTLSVITSAVTTKEDSSGNQGITIPILTHINDTPGEVLLWECFG